MGFKKSVKVALELKKICQKTKSSRLPQHALLKQVISEYDQDNEKQPT